MTDTYSIELIEEKLTEFGLLSCDIKGIKTLLTKPEWKPEIGQVVRAKGSHGSAYVGWTDNSTYYETRPLNKTEVGPDWIPAKDNWAIDAIQNIKIEAEKNTMISSCWLKTLIGQALSEHGIATGE